MYHDQPHLQHVQHGVQTEGAVFRCGSILVDRRHGAGGKRFQFRLLCQLHGAHGDPGVEGAAGAAVEDGLGDHICAVVNIAQAQMHVQHLLRGKGRVAVGKGHVEALTQGVEMGEVPVVVQKDSVAAALPGDEPAVAPAQQRTAQLPQQCEGIVAGFGDPVCCEEAQAAKEHLLRLRRLTHPVGEGPVGETVQAVIVFQNTLHDVAGLEAGVVQEILLAGGVVPLGEIDGAILRRKPAALVPYLRHEAAEAVGLVPQGHGPRKAEGLLSAVRSVEDQIIIVEVEEIGKTAALPAPAPERQIPVFVPVLKQIVSRGSTEGEAAVAALDGKVSLPVEGVEGFIAGKAEHGLGGIRLVPHGKAPAAKCIPPVSLLQMSDQSAHQPAPFFQAGRFADQIAEKPLVCFGQRLRHEAQLHEGTQADGKQKVKDLIHKGETVDRLPGGVLRIDVQFLREDAVEFDHAETDVLLHPAQDLLHVGEEERGGAGDADHIAPAVAQLQNAVPRADAGTAADRLNRHVSGLGLLQILLEPGHVVVLLYKGCGAFLRLLAAHFSAVEAGQRAVFLLEGLHEGVTVREAGVGGNGFNGIVRLQQLVHRVTEAYPGEVVQKGDAELLFKKLGEIGRGEVDPTRQLAERQILPIAFGDDAADLRHPDGVAVGPLVAGLGILNAEILIHHVHDVIDDGEVAQLEAGVPLGVVLYQPGDLAAQAVIGGAVSRDGAVAEKVRVPRVGKTALEIGLIELDGDDGAVRPGEGVWDMRLDGEHVRCLQGVDLLADAGLTAPGKDHVDLKKFLRMRFDAADVPHGAAERTFLRKAQDRVVFCHDDQLPSSTV